MPTQHPGCGFFPPPPGRSGGLAAYAFGKALDNAVQAAVAQGQLPSVAQGDVALFALAAGVIVHFAVFEPDCLPGNYSQFLHNVTGGKSSTPWSESERRGLMPASRSSAGLFSQINPTGITTSALAAMNQCS